MLFFLNLGNNAGVTPPPPPSTSQSPGGKFVYFSPDVPYKKFTKKDEKELKKLLLEVVEKESNAELIAKANELRKYIDVALGIRHAVDQAIQAIEWQLVNRKIDLAEAQRRIQRIEEEEDTLLLLSII
jgi:hypothetical protein